MIWFYIFSFLFGLTGGSFLNCLIYRLYYRKSILGRSFCPRCQAKIKWFDNIPLLSFVILKGRCRQCHQRISWQYPLVELITGLLFLFSFLRLSSVFMIHDSKFIILLLRDWLMIFVLIFIFVYDLKYYLIEDLIILPTGLIIFILNLFLKMSWLSLLLSALGAALFFLAQYFFTRGRGIGLGDFRFGILLGVYFGWPKIVLAILLAYIVGGLVGLALILLGRKKWTSILPLGPFLVVGSLITIFCGQAIINHYLLILK